MGIPNYSPDGTIMFGSVPWGSDYSNVRLYGSLSEQYSDISSMMTVKSDNYTYIGRNRQIKVAIPADRLYHCNYCMYRNNTITDGYIYCFITDVEYINDNTAQISIETDVFNTYLYGVDWTVPPCFIERATVSSEDERYMFTPEPDFPLTYKAVDTTDTWFEVGGYVIMSGSEPTETAPDLVSSLNPNGYFSKPAPVQPYKGIPNGNTLYYCPADGGGIDMMQTFLQSLAYAGATDAVTAIFAVPSFAKLPHSGFQLDKTTQDSPEFNTRIMLSPERGSELDGYTPKNKKMLYYPYNFCRLTDYNGSSSDLRFELWKGAGPGGIGLNYSVSPTCQAFAYPIAYAGGGSQALQYGIVTACGALGSWNNNAYETWLGQNGGTIALTIATAAIGAAAGTATIGSAARLLKEAAILKNAGFPKFAGMARWDAQKSMMAAGVAGAATVGATQMPQVLSASRLPSISRGQIDLNSMFAMGRQGVHAVRMCVISEIAEQIDEFFNLFGYAVERIENVNISSRPSWNYVKTGDCAPKSFNAGSSSTAPFSRGRGTPAYALGIIKSAFDGGVTFWHTTSGFGNYSLNNSI